MASLQSSDLSTRSQHNLEDDDDSRSLLDEPEPSEFRRASTSSEEDSIGVDQDEAGLLTANHNADGQARQTGGGYLLEGDSEQDNTPKVDLDDVSLADSSLANTPRRTTAASSNYKGATQSTTNKKIPQKTNLKPGRALAASTTTNGTSDDAGPSKRQNLTLKEQEKLIDVTKKENFSLKLKIYFLEERLAKLAPDQIDTALRENIELKVDFQTLQQELKKHKRMCLDLNKVVESLQTELEASQREVQSSSDGNDRADALQAELAALKADHERERKRWREQTGHSSNAQSEIDRLRRELQDTIDERDSLKNSQSSGQSSSDRRKIAELQKDNASLLSQINAQVTMLGTRNAEKDALYNEMEDLKQSNLELETQLDLSRSGTHRSTQSSLQGRSSRSGNNDKANAGGLVQELEVELNHYRDKLSGVMLEMERKEAEIEDLLQDGDQRDQEHAAELQDISAEADALRETLDQRDQEMRLLGKKIDEFEQLFSSKQSEVDDLLKEIDGKDSEINGLNEELDALTEDLKKLGQRVFQLEEELADKEDHLSELLTDAETSQHAGSLNQKLVDALKDKLSTARAQLNEYTASNQTLMTERNILRTQVEEFAVKTAQTEEQTRAESHTKRKLEDDRDQLERALQMEQAARQDEANLWKRQKRDIGIDHEKAVRELEKTLDECKSNLRQSQDRLKSREADLAKVQAALRAVENQSRSQSSNRSSLELEVDRLRRDLAHCEAELEEARNAVHAAEKRASQAVVVSAQKDSETRDLSDRLALQTTQRLQLSDRLDTATKTLNDVRQELNNERAKAAKIERSVTRTPTRSDDAVNHKVSERNSLLQKIYTDLSPLTERSSPSKREYTPANDFAPFSESLLTRLKQVTGIKALALKSIGEIERRFESKYSSLKQQHDSRMRQIDRLESVSKQVMETQRAWRQRVVLKQTEVDAAKTTNHELQTQISSLRQRMASGGAEPGSSAKLQSLQSKLSSTERRLMLTQAQLDDAEAKLEDGRRKLTKADDIWAARLQELQRRNKALEERIKGERQGGKERAAELMDQKQDLERQLSAAERRRSIVTDYVDGK